MTGMNSKLVAIFKATCLAAAALSLAAGTNAAFGASRYTVEAECSGGSKDVIVVKWPGYGTAMYVYDSGHLLTSGYVTKSVSGAGTSVKLISYALGSPLRGGANLRIRVRDTNFPQTAGMGHLTTAGENKLVDCSIY